MDSEYDDVDPDPILQLDPDMDQARVVLVLWRIIGPFLCDTCTGYRIRLITSLGDTCSGLDQTQNLTKEKLFFNDLSLS